ncbi:MAG: hypothetical protein KDB54_00410, partial [Solirubrobacterales bacterium]|nr:hypothetical protein [Solirubrobacterales bacterium]
DADANASGGKPPEAGFGKFQLGGNPSGALVRSCSFPFLPTATTDLQTSLYTYWRRASIKRFEADFRA